MTDQENMKAAVPDAAKRYMRYLLIMAGLGGLLYGVDVGVIAAALPYIEQTAGFNPSQLSQVVAAVLFGTGPLGDVGHIAALGFHLVQMRIQRGGDKRGRRTTIRRL